MGERKAEQGMGLRELKKRQTRENISHNATRLFLQHGYDKVTIADVAAASQVAKMTVTNYFPRKEDLALDLHEVFVDMPAKAVRERAEGESALAALRRDTLTQIVDHNAIIGFSGPAFAAMITGSPALVARLREFHEEREERLADLLASETGAAPYAIRPRVAAAQLIGVLKLLFNETMRLTLEDKTHDEIEIVLADETQQAFDALAPSLATYATR
ncbi:TetR/AcrR family transcriptional regulator [Actinomadura barringtoniae]|nr:TetR/AcrR family transcriptional regulator [Actinomadura barringtoniae]